MRPSAVLAFRPPTAKSLPIRPSNMLPSVHDLPIDHLTPPNKHYLTYKRSYPSGPQVHQVRLKYPYVSAQALADSISYHCADLKGAQILGQLKQAMGKLGSGKFSRPVTGMQIKINGVTHTETLRKTTIAFNLGNINNGHREHKQRTRVQKAGVRTAQVKLCGIATPF